MWLLGKNVCKRKNWNGNKFIMIIYDGEFLILFLFIYKEDLVFLNYLIRKK